MPELQADMVGCLLGALSALLTYRVMTPILKRQAVLAAYVPPIQTPGFKGFFYRHLADLRGPNEAAFGDILSKWFDDAAKDGKPAVVEASFGFHNREVFLPDPEDLAYILGSGSHQKDGAMTYVKDWYPYGGLEFLLGKNSLITIRDEHHHTIQRRGVSPAFSPGALAEIADTILVELFDNWTDCISKCVSGKGNTAEGKFSQSGGWSRMDLEQKFLKVSLDILTLAAFNKTDIGALEDTMHEVYLGHQSDPPSMLKMCYPVLESLMGPRATLRNIKTVLSVRKESLGLVKDMQNDMKSRSADGEPKKFKTIADLLMAMPGNDSTTQLTDHALTFIFAGHDTTTRALTWTAVLLATHPEVQDQLYEELSSAFSLTTTPKVRDLKGCSYLNDVIKESLRVRPPVPNVSRTNNKDDVLPNSKVFIPKGTCVTISALAVHKNKAVYGEDAEDFRPERWDEPLIQNQNESKIYIPFIAGKRSCIGRDFAMGELLIGIAVLVRKFELRWPEGRPLPAKIHSTTLIPGPSEFDIRHRTK